MSTTDAPTDDANRLPTTFDFDAADEFEPADIWIDHTYVNGYGDERAALEGSTYDAKDVIKFNWNVTHHKWTGDHWEVDADALDILAEKLEDEGYTTDFDDGHETQRDETLGQLIEAAHEGDRIEVVYQKKTGSGTSDYAGEVDEADYERQTDERGYTTSEPDYDAPRLRFTRDDGQRMYLKFDKHDKPALFTSGSHAPFVGELEAVTLGAEPDEQIEADSDDEQDDDDEQDLPEGLPTAEDILGGEN